MLGTHVPTKYCARGDSVRTRHVRRYRYTLGTDVSACTHHFWHVYPTCTHGRVHVYRVCTMYLFPLDVTVGENGYIVGTHVLRSGTYVPIVNITPGAHVPDMYLLTGTYVPHMYYMVFTVEYYRWDTRVHCRYTCTRLGTYVFIVINIPGAYVPNMFVCISTL